MKAVALPVGLGVLALVVVGGPGGAPDGSTSRYDGTMVRRAVVPMVAGGARIDVPAPYTRDPTKPVIMLADTVVGVAVLDEAGGRGVEVFETVTAAYWVWFPEVGRTAVFQGYGEWDPVQQSYVYDRGWSRLIPYTQDEDLEALFDMFWGEGQTSSNPFVSPVARSTDRRGPGGVLCGEGSHRLRAPCG